MKAVLYLRYSSDRQTEQSIEGQRRVCTEYAKKNEIEILGEYVDRATSASKDIKKRQEFLRMISDSNRKTFDAVLVYKLDRFARERYEEAIFKHKLKENGVRVISATESIPDDPTGVILESLISGMNQYYSMELSQKAKRGMYESALKGNSTGGNIPYGYRSVNKKLVVEEQEAAVLRELFSRYAEGEKLVSILKDFDARGIGTKDGKPLSKTSFQAVLRNKKYIGIYSYNKEVEIPNGCPAIVDEDIFNKVQRRLDANKLNKNAETKSHAKGLSGKVYCGECGEKMAATSGKSKTGDMHYYYKCENKCHKYIDRDKLEDAVFELLCKEYTPDKIERLAKDYVAETCERVEAQYNLSVLEDRKQTLRHKEKALLSLLVASEEDEEDILVEKIKKVKEERKIIEKKIASASVIIEKADKGEIIKFLSEVIEGKTDSPEFRQKIFDKLVNRVYVFSDRVVFTTYLESENDEHPLHSLSPGVVSSLTAKHSPPK